MSPLGLPPAYAELVERYRLSVLFKGGDLVLDDSGDLKPTRDGDLFFGSPPVNAMHRLVIAWSYNEPAMRLLFETINELHTRRHAVQSDLEHALASGVPSAYQAMQARDANVVGCGALAGSLAIVASSLLGRFRGDLKPPANDWEQGVPAFHGVSAGRLLIAAGNAFRHADEWAEARFSRAITGQQKASMDVLAQALAIDPFNLSDMREWEHAIDALSDGNFGGFAANVLSFANDVARMAQERLKSEES